MTQGVREYARGVESSDGIGHAKTRTLNRSTPRAGPADTAQDTGGDTTHSAGIAEGAKLTHAPLAWPGVFPARVAAW